MFHLNKLKWEKENKIRLIQDQNGKQVYFNGLDRGLNLGETELSVWEADNLLVDYRKTFLNSILFDLGLAEAELKKFESTGEIDEDNLVKLYRFVENEDLKGFHTNRKHLSSYQFAGYHYSWTKTFFEKVILPVWNVNKKIDYQLNQKFSDVLAQYSLNYDKLTNDELKAPKFHIVDDLKDKNNRYITHPKYPIELGASKISPFNFGNQAQFMVERDYQFLLMGFEPLSKDKSINQNRMATNFDNPFWSDVSLLQAFNAFPYNNEGDMTDSWLLNILARIMRVDQDITMTYKSQISGFSYMWGYMPEEADYKALVFKSGSVIKKIPIYQAKYQDNVANNDKKIIDFDHTFYLKSFMDRVSKESLTKLIKRKAWITDWNLIDDFNNAIVPTGKYDLSFEDENGNLIPVKGYDNPNGSKSFQWKLNPWGDYDVFSGFQFYYDGNSKIVKLKVNHRSWFD